MTKEDAYGTLHELANNSITYNNIKDLITFLSFVALSTNFLGTCSIISSYKSFRFRKDSFRKSLSSLPEIFLYGKSNNIKLYILKVVRKVVERSMVNL